MEKLSITEIKNFESSFLLFAFLSDNLKEINFSVTFYDRIFFRNALYNLNNIVMAFPDKLQLTKEELLNWEAIFKDGLIKSKRYENLKPLGKRVIDFWSDYQSSL